MKTPAFLLSFTAILAHFFLVNFILLERDYKWIMAVLSGWVLANLATEVDGLFFSQMQGAKNSVKISLAAFFIVATTCLYFVLSKVSQSIKGIREKHERKRILRDLKEQRLGVESDGEAESEYEDPKGDEEETDERRESLLGRNSLNN